MSSYFHSTYQEMRFLDRIGSFGKHRAKPLGTGFTRRELLEKYLTTMPVRDRWGDIDPNEVAKYIHLLLSKTRT